MDDFHLSNERFVLEAKEETRRIRRPLQIRVYSEDACGADLVEMRCVPETGASGG